MVPISTEFPTNLIMYPLVVMAFIVAVWVFFILRHRIR